MLVLKLPIKAAEGSLWSVSAWTQGHSCAENTHCSYPSIILSHEESTQSREKGLKTSTLVRCSSPVNQYPLQVCMGTHRKFSLGKGVLITLKNNHVKWNALGVNYFMSSLYLPICAINEYFIMLTTSEEKEIYVTAFELGTLSGACILWKIDSPL